MARIRGFVENFFGCSYCRAHFLEAFDGCRLERCALGPMDQEGVAVWLWKMHNDVTLRVAKEDGREVPRPWPEEGRLEASNGSVEDCPGCWACQECWQKGSRMGGRKSYGLETLRRQGQWLMGETKC